MAEQLALTRPAGNAVANPNRTVRQQVPAFLNKLYSMVNDPATDELIRWSDEGDSFLVPNHERFGRELLPRFFKHGNFSSFVRQLNMYGFHKVPHLQQGVLQNETETELWQFVNPHFQRGQPDLLILIQRKKSANNPNSAVDDEGSSAVAGPSSTSSTGPIDLGAIAGGLATIKRHQSIISAELKDLQQSNTALWQEAVAARERHKKHQDTINRILKFLAGVFGNNLSPQTVPRSPGSGHNGVLPVIPRKRPRLMIQDTDRSEESPMKGRKRYLEETEEDDDDDDELIAMDTDMHEPVAPRIDEMTTPVTPALSSARIESVASTPAAAADDAKTFRDTTAITRRQPRVTATSKTSAQSAISPNPSGVLSVPESSFSTSAQGPAPNYLYPNSMALNPYFPSTQSYPPTSTSLPPNPNTGVPGSSLNSDSDPFQGLLNSPGSLQRMLNALSQPQSIPAIPSMPPSYDSDNYSASLPSQLEPTHLPLEPMNGDLSTALFNHNNGVDTEQNISSSSLTPESMLALFNSFQPSATGDIQLLDDGSYHLDSGLGQAVDAQTGDLRRAYRDAASINADVDAIQQSISSLIQSMGIEPSSMGSLRGEANATSDTSQGAADKGLLDNDPSAVDFDALLNQFSHGAATDMVGSDGLSGVDFPFDLDREASSLSGPSLDQEPAISVSAMPSLRLPSADSAEEPVIRRSLEENTTTSTASSPSQSLSGDNPYPPGQESPTSRSKTKGGRRKSNTTNGDNGVGADTLAAHGPRKGGKVKRRK